MLQIITCRKMFKLGNPSYKNKAFGGPSYGFWKPHTQSQDILGANVNVIIPSSFWLSEHFFPTNNVYRFSVLHSEEDYENKKLFQVICILSKKKRKECRICGCVWVCACEYIYVCVWDTGEMCEAHHHSQPGNLFIWISTAFLMAIPRDKHLLIWKQAMWFTNS